MHKGRVYPFHPDYWATEGWMWPGYVPWKMSLDVYDNALPPWNIYGAGYGEVSQPGVVSADYQKITYEFTHYAPSWGLIVTLDTTVFEHVKMARWKMTLVSGIVTWAQAIELKPAMRKTVFNRTWTYVMPAPPYTANASPPYQLTPTLYYQGGSPWP